MIGEFTFRLHHELLKQLESGMAHGHHLPALSIAHELHLLFFPIARPGHTYHVKPSSFNDPQGGLVGFRARFNPSVKGGRTQLSLAVCKANRGEVLFSYDHALGRYVWSLGFFAEGQLEPIATARIRMTASGELTDFQGMFKGETF